MAAPKNNFRQAALVFSLGATLSNAQNAAFPTNLAAEDAASRDALSDGFRDRACTHEFSPDADLYAAYETAVGSNAHGASFWRIQYGNFVKVIDNCAARERYILSQCVQAGELEVRNTAITGMDFVTDYPVPEGCYDPAPSADNVVTVKHFTIPLEKIALASSNAAAAIAPIGINDRVLHANEWIFDPCIRYGMAESCSAFSLFGGSGWGGGSSAEHYETDDAVSDLAEVDAVFGNNAQASVDKLVSVSYSSRELSLKARLSWVLYAAAFFNLENRAATFVADQVTLLEAAEAAAPTTDKKVLAFINGPSQWATTQMAISMAAYKIDIADRFGFTRLPIVDLWARTEGSNAEKLAALIAHTDSEGNTPYSSAVDAWGNGTVSLDAAQFWAALSTATLVMDESSDATDPVDTAVGRTQFVDLWSMTAENAPTALAGCLNANDACPVYRLDKRVGAHNSNSSSDWVEDGVLRAGDVSTDFVALAKGEYNYERSMFIRHLDDEQELIGVDRCPAAERPVACVADRTVALSVFCADFAKCCVVDNEGDCQAAPGSDGSSASGKSVGLSFAATLAAVFMLRK